MKKIILIAILICIVNHIKINAQCNINAGKDQTIICGQSAQLQAIIDIPEFIKLNSNTNNYLKSIYCTNDTTAYAVGNWGTILKTTDRGENWILQNSGVDTTLNSVFFIDENTGYATGGAYVLKTINGGINWENIKIGDPHHHSLNSVFFANADTGYAAGNDHFFITTDGGSTWGTIDSILEIVNSIYFTDAKTGYAIGRNNISKTIDCGKTWQEIHKSLSYLFSIHFIDENTGYAAGNNIILKTTDAGLNWSEVNLNITQDLLSIYFINADSGFAVGISGKIFQTKDGGDTWMQLISGTDEELYSVNFIGANDVYVVGNNGTILKHRPYNINYKWTPSTNLSADDITNPIANPIETTTYTLTVNTDIGCSTYDSITITVKPLTVSAGVNKSITCGETANLTCNTNLPGNINLTYNWSPSAGLNATDIFNPTAHPKENTVYTVTVSTDNGCTASGSVEVVLNKLIAPDICIVGVDSVSNKNRIVWEKPINMPVDSFIVYKESNVSGVYNKIALIPYSEFSVFIDTSSSPLIKSSSYKISMIDSCGIESNISSLHKTIHLNINQGQENTWNLIWNDYIGFTVASYNIYRGTSPENLVLINTTTAGNTSFSDFSAPSGYIYYQIEVISPNLCNPSKKLNYNSSKSNIATNDPAYSINDNIINKSFINIYPNPAKDKIIIENTGNTNEAFILSLMNIQGQEVYKENYYSKSSHTIDISNLRNGIYFLAFRNEKEYFVRKIVINR